MEVQHGLPIAPGRPDAPRGPRAGDPGDRGSAACNSRNNNTFAKLLECVTVDGVRQHQAEFQEIADANGGTRASGTPGYDASVAYVVELLQEAGYEVTVLPFDYVTFTQLGPSTLEQTVPTPTTYEEGVDYELADQTEPGDVTASVRPWTSSSASATPPPAAARRPTSPGSLLGRSRSSSAARARSR